MDYSFVPRIGTLAFDAPELVALRAGLRPGSHAEAILREALLFREPDLERLGTAVQAMNGDLVFHSFGYPALRGAALLVRSEYLLLREVGNGVLDLDDPPALAARILARLAAHAPRAVVYRLCDYNPGELRFLGPRGGTSRGAQRLLERPDLLALDLAVVAGLRDAGVPVEVILPFVQLSSQAEALRARVREALGSGRTGPPRIGMMLEVPANLFEVPRYAALDFFAFGSADLLQALYGGLERGSRAFEEADPRVLRGPIEQALVSIDRLGGKRVYLVKSAIALAEEIGLARFPRTSFRRIWFPDQL